MCARKARLSGMATGPNYRFDSSADGVIGVHEILPSQFYGLLRGNRLTGEQRLMLALLADAINVYQQGVMAKSTRKRILYVDAERWIMTSRPIRHAFGFETVCEALNIDPAGVRRAMVEWKHRVKRAAETRAPQHLRLKITPRARNLSHATRRRGDRQTVNA